LASSPVFQLSRSRAEFYTLDRPNADGPGFLASRYGQASSRLDFGLRLLKWWALNCFFYSLITARWIASSLFFFNLLLLRVPKTSTCDLQCYSQEFPSLLDCLQSLFSIFERSDS